MVRIESMPTSKSAVPVSAATTTSHRFSLCTCNAPILGRTEEAARAGGFASARLWEKRYCVSAVERSQNCTRHRSKRMTRQPSRLLSQTSRPWVGQDPEIPSFLTTSHIKSSFYFSPSILLFLHSSAFFYFILRGYKLGVTLGSLGYCKNLPPDRQASVSRADSPKRPSVRHGMRSKDWNLKGLGAH